MPRVRRRGNSLRNALTPPQELALLIGGDWPQAFGTEQAAREAWWRHRDEMIGAVNPTTRPRAWWLFEAPEMPKQGEHQYQALERLGLLTDSERALLARWRKDNPAMWGPSCHA